jgi:hypothetical protein
MKLHEIAKKLAIQHNMISAERYDLSYREYDDMVEVIGWVQDPNYNMSDFQGREMLFPKRWLTLGVLPATTEVKV